VGLAQAYDLVVFDLDGVVYLGTRAVPGAAQAIRTLIDAGVPVAYATNNASRRAAEVAQLLVSLGVPATPDDVVTSARATAQLLAGDLPPGAPVLAVGAPALREELAGVGLTPVETAEDRPVAVVQGYGPEVGWAMLAEACVAIRAGARWVATNVDATMPSPRGPVPGNGSLVAALRTALSGQEPDTVVGKPGPALLTTTAALRGAHRVLVVGDRLDTDVEGAIWAGMDSLLVLTGVTTPADLLAAAQHRRPTHVAADCRALSTLDEASRVPEWCDGATSGRWRAAVEDDHLVLEALRERSGDDGGGEPAGDDATRIDADRDDAVDALRVLARGAWECPEWTAIRTDGRDAEAALTALGLGRFAAWATPAV
jgi:HAD superfamily hydrolase (TIGR01450 family)